MNQRILVPGLLKNIYGKWFWFAPFCSHVFKDLFSFFPWLETPVTSALDDLVNKVLIHPLKSLKTQGDGHTLLALLCLDYFTDRPAQTLFTLVFYTCMHTRMMCIGVAQASSCGEIQMQMLMRDCPTSHLAKVSPSPHFFPTISTSSSLTQSMILKGRGSGQSRFGGPAASCLSAGKLKLQCCGPIHFDIQAQCWAFEGQPWCLCYFLVLHLIS